jgi:hypothetical protein
MGDSSSWYGESTFEGVAVKTKTDTVWVHSSDLRPGDLVHRSKDGPDAPSGHWGVVIVRTEKGLGWRYDTDPVGSVHLNHEPRFYNAGWMWEVRMPRPEPEVNEFGPVSP